MSLLLLLLISHMVIFVIINFLTSRKFGHNFSAVFFPYFYQFLHCRSVLKRSN